MGHCERTCIWVINYFFLRVPLDNRNKTNRNFLAMAGGLGGGIWNLNREKLSWSPHIHPLLTTISISNFISHLFATNRKIQMNGNCGPPQNVHNTNSLARSFAYYVESFTMHTAVMIPLPIDNNNNNTHRIVPEFLSFSSFGWNYCHNWISWMSIMKPHNVAIRRICCKLLTSFHSKLGCVKIER